MKNHNNEDTAIFDKSDFNNGYIKQTLIEVVESLEARGYNAVNQLTGYLISNDPAYISSYQDARTKIQTIERYEIIEALVKSYLSNR